jgi:hypothetical protein
MVEQSKERPRKVAGGRGGKKNLLQSSVVLRFFQTAQLVSCVLFLFLFVFTAVMGRNRHFTIFLSFRSNYSKIPGVIPFFACFGQDRTGAKAQAGGGGKLLLRYGWTGIPGSVALFLRIGYGPLGDSCSLEISCIVLY